MPDTEFQNSSDTELARLLFSARRLPLDQLSPLLDRVRVERVANPSATLATLLVQAGVVSHEELHSLQSGGVELSHSTEIGSARRPVTLWGPGGHVAGYELGEVLGRGGMGVVFRARQLATGREVALKGVNFQLAEGIAERFGREAAVQAAVDGHPNVVRVYEAGQLEGHGYLAMELLTGGDLNLRLRHGPFAAADAARTVAQLARGLAHVHAHGILHRDLKPANVLFDEQGVPKLVDFGLARVNGAQQLTLTGQLIGTPAYMAPEQAIGLNELDARTDVYGLGAILYACLTGQPPFQGQLTEVIAAVISDPPVRPRTVVPDVDPALEALCLQALQKAPEDRYADAELFAEALEAWGADRVGPSPRGQGRGRRGVVPLALAAGVGVGLALGIAFRGGEAGEASVATPVDAASVAEAQPGSPAGQEQPAPDETAQQDPPTHDAPPQEQPPQERLPNAELELGRLVGVKVKGGRRLAVVAGLSGTGKLPEVEVEIARQPAGSLGAPLGGFLRDGLGVGAQVVRAKRTQAEFAPKTVIRRVGPLALVEDGAGAREWRSVFGLVQVGEGVDPGADVECEIKLAPWANGTKLYPAVVLRRDLETERALVVYLDEGSQWVDSGALRPLPVVMDRVHYDSAEDDDVAAVVVGYPEPWVVEVVRTEDQKRIFVDLSRIEVTPEDRD